ncbi:TetR/AcrR family transcriptional regulator [Actinomadura kijaniata]|uniref:AcrR family transcriptional regulator n=1 Tax=Actinomadura namibiensis TaxID=182080 RepID=A0A7W3LYE0_ACTNM|nr:helix-turn-helix domain-containing protein [Actinomadura namibiensis]MBA8956628.1 AcrR family transcriptional regulator [Actinomadura namibiensis]
MTEGLRERKKRQTRRRIAGTAARLFAERGFDHVTIAEVAEAADVSVNTVYNYFEAKEDLVLPPDQASPDRLAAIVRDREPGEPAFAAVLRRLRDELRRRDRSLGLIEGFGRFLEMVRAAPTLVARLEDLHVQMVAALTAELAKETGADPDDPLPALVAGQIGWLHAHVLAESGRHALAGHTPDATAEALLALLDEAETLIGERALTYAVRKG